MSFSEFASDSGVSCSELASDNDDAAETDLETDTREPRRASARLAALAAQ